MWAWKSEYDIDAWSYRKGVAEGYIPKNVSDPSSFEFPILANGCIDTSHSYTAPASVSTALASPTSNSGSGSSSGSGSAASATADSNASPTAKSSKSSAASSSEVPTFWIHSFGVLAVASFALMSLL